MTGLQALKGPLLKPRRYNTLWQKYKLILHEQQNRNLKKRDTNIFTNLMQELKKKKCRVMEAFKDGTLTFAVEKSFCGTMDSAGK